MPSSADEAFGQEENVERKDSLRQPTSKKQKKKAKKSAAAAKLIGDHADELPSDFDSSSPPLDLLSASPGIGETLSRALSVPDQGRGGAPLPPSPPLVTASEAEPSLPDTPPIFAQDLHDDTVKPVFPELPRFEFAALSPHGPSVREDTWRDPPESTDDQVQPKVPLPRGPANGIARFSPPSPSPLAQETVIRSPPVSPRLPSLSPRPTNVQPNPRQMAPKSARKPSVTEAAPPHKPQRHFSRVPDASFALHDTSGKELAPGSDKYFCGFDSLDGASADTQDSASNVLLIGSEGALDLCRYNRNRREVIGRLEGLRGSVVEARILPAFGPEDGLSHYRPLVACVIHGPTLRSPGDDGGVSLSDDSDTIIDSYQTTVEIFSLKRSMHVATLFQSAPQPLPRPVGHALFTEPPIEDCVTMDVAGRYVLVGSGRSGELLVFAPDQTSNPHTPFRCLGKYWTRTKEHSLHPHDPNLQDQKSADEEMRKTPIFALSPRWLAISPPSLSSSQKSIDGTATVDPNRPSPPGLVAYVSPPPPAIDCEVDAPAGPSLLGRVTKQATHEIRKGAQWVGEQGISMLKGYWKGAAPTGIPQLPSVSARKSPTEDVSPAFPPTHGQGREASAVKVESALVSIIDLRKLDGFESGLVKNPLAPLATFHLGDGCSFLSFAPSGLGLLTTNQVGDTSTVWDLMRITDSRGAAALTATSSQIPHASGLVRKTVSFSRLSPSVVVDVRWTTTSNRLGLLTSKGTLHLHELPRHDPLPAAIRSPAAATSIPGVDLPSPSTSPRDLTSGWMTGVRTGWSNVSGRLTAIRSASETNGGSIVTSTRQSINQASVAARYASGRAVRNGYNSALEGAYSLRHSQDNKIRLKSLYHAVSPGCFRWLTGKDEGLISTMADGTLCTYTVKSNYHIQGRRTIVVLDASRKAGPAQTLTPIAGGKLAPAILGRLHPQGPHASCARAGVHGFWTLNRDAAASPPTRPARSPPAAIQQDKETCPQYLPLHRLKQVSLYTYSDGGGGGGGSGGKDTDETVRRRLGQGRDGPWCFGQPLGDTEKVAVVVVRRGAGQAVYDGEERGAFDGMVGQMEEDFALDEGMRRTLTNGFGSVREGLI